ncbi:MAG: hypothetical protein Q9171_002785 [Xanthocarpia ochracea]
MAASLTTLPPETLRQIIRNIPKNSHLLDLALCCRPLYGSVLPELYTHLSLTEVYSNTRFWSKLRLLTSRILSDPILASHVRSIIFEKEWNCDWLPYGDDGDGDEDENNDDNDNDRDGRNEQSDTAGHLETGNEESIDAKAAGDDMSDLLHLLQPMSASDRDELLKGHNKDALMALLVQAVPNLKIMSLVIPPGQATILTKVIERAASDRTDPQARPSIKTFSRLQVVISSRHTRGPSMNTDLLYHYIRLPAIRQICMQCVDSPDSTKKQQFPLATLEHGSCPTVEHLELRENNINNAKDLKGMLAACSNLRTFVFEFQYQEDDIPKELTEQLRESLSAKTETLENLWLDYEGDETYSQSCMDGLAASLSLTGFRKLKNLKVGMHVFFGNWWDRTDEPVHATRDAMVELPDLGKILPESLETLYILNTHLRVKVLVKALHNLLSVKQICLPNLREIAFNFFPAFPVQIDYSSARKSLQDMAVRAEVQLRIVDIVEKNEREEEGGDDRYLSHGWLETHGNCAMEY